MIFHVAMHVTILLIVAFFILFAAGRAEGFAKLLGTVLGYWLVFVAIVIVAGCVTAPMFGGKPFGLDIHGMHDHWMHHDGGPGMTPPPGTPSVPPPGTY